MVSNFLDTRGLTVSTLSRSAVTSTVFRVMVSWAINDKPMKTRTKSMVFR